MTARRSAFDRWLSDELEADRVRHTAYWYRAAMQDAGCSCESPTEPTNWRETEPGWLVARYRCPTCDTEWSCGWARSMVEDPP